MWAALLNGLLAIWDRVAGLVKAAGVYVFASRYERTKITNSQLEAANAVKDQQLKVAADPAVGLDDVRDLMQRDEF